MRERCSGKCQVLFEGGSSAVTGPVASIWLTHLVQYTPMQYSCPDPGESGPEACSGDGYQSNGYSGYYGFNCNPNPLMWVHGNDLLVGHYLPTPLTATDFYEGADIVSIDSPMPSPLFLTSYFLVRPVDLQPKLWRG